MNDVSHPQPHDSKDRQWVVFGPDWGRHPCSTHHLFSELLAADPVLWVETVGLRPPRWNLRDLWRCWQKIMDYCSGRRRRVASVQSRLTVVCPLTLPFTQYHWARRFNFWQIHRCVTRACRRLGFKDFALVVTVPSQCDVVGRLGERLSVYYCCDNYALWPGMNARHVQCMEQELTERVDAIAVVSEPLSGRFKSCGKPVLVLTQGVDAAHFTPSLRLEKNSRFEIVYFGMIDERLDVELLIEISQRLPEAWIRLIGPVVIDPGRLRELPNVKLEPQVPFADLPTALTDADLFILPFQLNELSMSCSPLKLKEYLACGRPVVATAVPEALRLAPLVHVAKDRAAFCDAVATAMAGRLPFDSAAVKSMIAQEGWNAKAQEFTRFVESLEPRD